MVQIETTSQKLVVLVMKYKRITVLDRDLYLVFLALIRNGPKPHKMGFKTFLKFSCILNGDFGSGEVFINLWILECLLSETP